MLTSDKDKQAWQYQGKIRRPCIAMHFKPHAAELRTAEREQEVDVRTLANACVRMKGFATRLHAVMSMIRKCKRAHTQDIHTCARLSLWLGIGNGRAKRVSLAMTLRSAVLHGCQPVDTHGT